MKLEEEPESTHTLNSVSFFASLERRRGIVGSLEIVERRAQREDLRWDFGVQSTLARG
jgi:hypothetical protein